MIDGATEFGKELDSLTDMISFGIAPAFILYFWELKNYGKIGWAITLIFSVCCVLRLARFNLTKITENDSWKLNYFEGVPSPAGGGLILLPLIYELSEINSVIDVKSYTPYFVVLVSILLISKIPTFAFKKISLPKYMFFYYLDLLLMMLYLFYF